MDTKENNASPNANARDILTNRTEQRSSVPNDLTDNQHDQERLRPEESVINLPDVEDIPGQENVTVAPLGEMADTTASSADEEGDRIFNQEEGAVPLRMGTEGDVNPKERRALDDDYYTPTRDADNLRNATMGNTDFQGEELNEESFGGERSGYNLDIPDSRNDILNPFLRHDENKNEDYQVGSGDNE